LKTFNRVPVQENVDPPYVNANRTTALAALMSAAVGFAVHATSSSHEPAEPIALNGSGDTFNSAAPAAARCEIAGISMIASPGETPAGNASSTIAWSPSMTGDQYGNDRGKSRAATGPKTFDASAPA